MIMLQIIHGPLQGHEVVPVHLHRRIRVYHIGLLLFRPLYQSLCHFLGNDVVFEDDNWGLADILNVRVKPCLLEHLRLDPLLFLLFELS
jgi:hypothetical protein